MSALALTLTVKQKKNYRGEWSTVTQNSIQGDMTANNEERMKSVLTQGLFLVSLKVVWQFLSPEHWQCTCPRVSGTVW